MTKLSCYGAMTPAWLGVALAALVACRANPAAPQPTVSFLLDAPLCSSQIPVQFSIDHLQVGADLFVVNLANQHLQSQAFTTTAGQHTLGARVVTTGYAWPDKTVLLVQGQAFTDTLPFSCS